MAAMMLPFAAIGAGGYLAERKKNPQQKRTSVSEDKAELRHEAIMSEYGMSASAWQAPFNRAVLMGAPIKDAAGLDVRAGGYPYHTDADPLEYTRREHADLTKYDRLNSEVALDTRRGDVRPRNKIAIAATLSNELVAPTGATTEFGRTRQEYFRATPGIMQDGTKIITVPTRLDVGSSRVDTTAIVHGQSVFRGNAPWQSFRYSEF